MIETFARIDRNEMVDKISRACNWWRRQIEREYVYMMN